MKLALNQDFFLSIVVIFFMFLFHKHIFVHPAMCWIMIVAFFVSSFSWNIHIIHKKILLISALFICLSVYFFLRIEPITITALAVGASAWVIPNDQSIAIGTILAGLVFFIGNAYGRSHQKLFKTGRYVALFYVTSLVIKMFKDFIAQESIHDLWIGKIVLIFAPLASLIFYQNSRYKRCGDALLLITVIALLFSSSRVSALCILVFLGIFHIRNNFRWTKTTHSLFFIIFFAILSAFIYVYGRLEHLSWAQDLDKLSWKYFNKSFFSGRNFIWPELLEIISRNPLWGQGSFQESYYYASTALPWRNLSSHNTFLEILVRGGLVGLAIFTSILYAIWMCLYDKSHSLYARFGIAYFMAIIINVFSAEYLITQNLTTNLIIWFCWGACVGNNLRSEVSTQQAQI